MGLLSRLTRKVTPQKKATDDVLLVHAMMLMCGADGAFDLEEIDTVRAYFSAVPEFRGKEFDVVFEEARKVVDRHDSLSESISALAELSTDALKHKAFLMAADIAMSTGDVDDAEDRMLEAMQRVMEVPDEVATRIIEVLNIKYAF
jgi:uncharacterized tellurite resistance protein B-like protein